MGGVSINLILEQGGEEQAAITSGRRSMQPLAAALGVGPLPHPLQYNIAANSMFMRCLCDVYAQALPLRSEEGPPSRQSSRRVTVYTINDVHSNPPRGI
jgi:hypothetical protein